jgi:hypothetical protein
MDVVERGQVPGDVGPTPAVVARFEDVRGEIIAAVPIDGDVGDGRITLRGFHPIDKLTG